VGEKKTQIRLYSGKLEGVLEIVEPSQRRLICESKKIKSHQRMGTMATGSSAGRIKEQRTGRSFLSSKFELPQKGETAQTSRREAHHMGTGGTSPCFQQRF